MEGFPDTTTSKNLPCSCLSDKFQVLPLRTNLRLSRSTTDELRFADWLLDVGHGKNIDVNGTIPFDTDMRVPDTNTLIWHIYPNIDSIQPPPAYFLDRIILAT